MYDAAVQGVGFAGMALCAGWIRVGKLAVVGPGWMAYDWLAGSFGGVVSEAIGWCSSLASLLYYRWWERRESDPV